mmetsp:Transcript_33816/g.32269  ORF Transcript_33816/g.32269 Transcript_33816/m.32269 type:complete len:1231 (+) Transcript_33816:59-3751(+)
MASKSSKTAPVAIGEGVSNDFVTMGKGISDGSVTLNPTTTHQTRRVAPAVAPSSGDARNQKPGEGNIIGTMKTKTYTNNSAQQNERDTAVAPSSGLARDMKQRKEKVTNTIKTDVHSQKFMQQNDGATTTSPSVPNLNRNLKQHKDRPNGKASTDTSRDVKDSVQHDNGATAATAPTPNSNRNLKKHTIRPDPTNLFTKTKRQVNDTTPVNRSRDFNKPSGGDSTSLKISHHNKIETEDLSIRKNGKNNPNASMMSCVICTEDNIKFAAVGLCEHSICSLCSMRIRVKSNDKNCPLCKQAMDIVIVFSTTSKGDHSFESYGISDIDSPAPGLDIDHRAAMIYADCRKHYVEMDNLRSIVCPLKKCHERFPTDENLMKHLSAAHPGHVLCKLCLQHRPLFIAEQSLMTIGELKRHMSALPGALTGAGGDKTGGHPLCLFCDEYFYDSSALYIHMKQEHQTCHLCPVELQHRFYPSMEELKTHLRGDHFVCDICETNSLNGVEGVGVFGSSFRYHGEYAAHLQSMHGGKKASMQLGFRVGRSSDGDVYRGKGKFEGKGDPNRRIGAKKLPFLDLDMSQADPYRNRSSNSQSVQRNRQIRGNGVNHHQINSSTENTSTGESGKVDKVEETSEERRRQLFHLQREAAMTAAPLVPGHMRVAGRIIAGKLRRDIDDDVLQASIDEQAIIAASTSSAPVPANWVGRPGQRGSMNMNFPALASGVQKEMDGDQMKGNIPTTPHPLSLVHGIQREAAAKKLVEDKQKQKEVEEEEKKAIRNKNIAKLFSGENGNLAEDNDVTFQAIELQRPLYPSALLSWGRINKVELLKLEKKMLELISDKKSNSSQLKPMTSSTRNIIHGLAKYYSLNSYEYDTEPKRYVSLVKTIDTCAPPLKLSFATTSAILPNLSSLISLCVPTLYISLMNPSSGFVATDVANEAMGRGNKKASVSSSSYVTASDVLWRVQAVLKAQFQQFHPYSHHQSHKITSLKSAGASAVALSFINIETAVKVIDMIKIYKQHGAHPSTDIISGLLDNLLIEPGFDPDLYKDVLEEESSQDVKGNDVSYSVKPAEFPFDDNCKPSYSMPMPIRSTTPVEKVSFPQKNTLSAGIEEKRGVEEINSRSLILKDSMAAASLRDEWDDEDENDINNNKDFSDEFQDCVKSVSIPLTQNDGSSIKIEYDQKEVLQKHKPIFDERFNSKTNSSTYRHLELKPRSNPLPPNLSNGLPPAPPVEDFST